MMPVESIHVVSSNAGVGSRPSAGTWQVRLSNRNRAYRAGIRYKSMAIPLAKALARKYRVVVYVHSINMQIERAIRP